MESSEGGGGDLGANNEAAAGGKAADRPLDIPRIPGQLRPRESPLLIFTCKRANYLRQTLDDIFKHLPPADDKKGGGGGGGGGSICLMGCPIIVSQDGTDPDVSAVVEEYAGRFWVEKHIPLLHWQHQPTAKAGLRGALSTTTNAYEALAIHYGWALSKLFDPTNPPLIGKGAVYLPLVPERVLILEEDLHVAPDFFSYFVKLAPLLDTDPSLLAISAFNDNGFQGHVHDPQRVLRSDFFPGLGWMMTRKLWIEELKEKWPGGYWDDWLREPQQRKGRHILRPEISRTFHFGTQGGASGNQFGSHLSSVWLNPTPVNWTNVDLSYLRMDRYDRQYWNRIRASHHANTLKEALQHSIVVHQQSSGGDVRVEYNSLQEFMRMANELGIMSDEKAGVPRTSYKGVVEYRPHEGLNGTLFLSPPLINVEKVHERMRAAIQFILFCFGENAPKFACSSCVFQRTLRMIIVSQTCTFCAFPLPARISPTSLDHVSRLSGLDNPKRFTIAVSPIVDFPPLLDLVHHTTVRPFYVFQEPFCKASR
jgi:alpha-1,3-mannosyl-glycoprotein beta-1,2-N-acetylglucosaminyltransferase